MQLNRAFSKRRRRDVGPRAVASRRRVELIEGLRDRARLLVGDTMAFVEEWVDFFGSGSHGME